MDILELLKEKKAAAQKIFLPTEKQACLKRIQEILAEHDNKESDIPVDHGYWELINFYRVM